MKIVKNDKDFFDQSLDEVKLLKMMNDADANDEKNIVRMLDFFYHREHLFIVTELLGLNLYEHQKLSSTMRRPAPTRAGSSLSLRRLSSKRARRGSEGADTGDDPSSSSFSERQSSLRESPYFSVKALRVVAKQVLVALEFMHARGVIHCDVKPENIVLRRGDAAAAAAGEGDRLGELVLHHGLLSTYVQSRSYRAPEVVLGAPYDGKAGPVEPGVRPGGALHRAGSAAERVHANRVGAGHRHLDARPRAPAPREARRGARNRRGRAVRAAGRGRGRRRRRGRVRRRRKRRGARARVASETHVAGGAARAPASGRGVRRAESRERRGAGSPAPTALPAGSPPPSRRRHSTRRPSRRGRRPTARRRGLGDRRASGRSGPPRSKREPPSAEATSSAFP